MNTANFLKRTVLIFTAIILAGVMNVYGQDNIEKGNDAVLKGDYVKALEYLKTAPKDKYEGSLYYGIALFKTGSIDEAEKYLKGAISIDNEKPEAYAVLGELYSSKKKYSDAEKWLTESLDIARSIKNKSQIYSVDIALGKLKTITKD